MGVAIGISLLAGTDAKGATVTEQSFPPSTGETWASATGENGAGETVTAKRSSVGETSGSAGESSASFTRVNDSTEVVINFRLDKVVYDPAYMGNNERFNELTRLLAAVKADPDTRLKNIRITSSASPEGPYKHNVDLSIERGKTLIKLIKKQDPTLNDDIFVITSLGEAWDGAIKAVEEGDMPHKEEALEIMRNTPENVIKGGKVVDTRKRQMMNLAGGTVWRYMIENYFPSLRQTSVFVVFKTKRLVNTLEELAPIYACAQQSAPGELARGEVRMPEPVVERKPIIAVKSNLLYDVLATPNIAVELPLGQRWSIFADYTFPWWEWDDNSRAWEDLDWKLGARCWAPATGSETGPSAMCSLDFSPVASELRATTMSSHITRDGKESFMQLAWKAAMHGGSRNTGTSRCREPSDTCTPSTAVTTENSTTSIWSTNTTVSTTGWGR